MAESEESNISAQGKVAIRNNWLKIFVVTVTVIVVGWKTVETDFSAAFSDFQFSDLLALFLAMFAIALSVLFYLKATDTANVFYDNTYRFTRDVSEILGRVEAGFGEKLAHLDEGYSGLKSAVEQIPFDKKQTERDIEEEEEQLHKVEKERMELIESLAERARLEGEEKERLFEQLQEQDEELSNARREISLLRRNMKMAAAGFQEGSEIGVSPNLINYLRKVAKARIPDEILQEAPMRILNEYFKGSVLGEDVPSQFIFDLQKSGIIDEDNDLTRKGRAVLRSVLGQ
ncbi:hypothetical protein [Salinisphaera shabanensis]|uniref:hypothetical protein n=1 Tax=Salinisphaera shabanensis TaxID=180542 RepID=UPI00333E604E